MEREQLLIRETLKRTNGKRGEAAELLQIDPKTLYNKFRQYQLSGEVT